MIPILKKIDFAYISSFANLKPKSKETAKKRKTHFINVPYNPILRLPPAWEAPFCQKSQNRCTLQTMCLRPQL
jgi:hypothetical protein